MKKYLIQKKNAKEFMEKLNRQQNKANEFYNITFKNCTVNGSKIWVIVG